MPRGQADAVLRLIGQLAGADRAGTLTDQELLRRFAAERDALAFEGLVHRHGLMVLRLCLRVLGNKSDAEDVFQATFLTLARNAASLRRPQSVGSWLYGVAHRLALKANTDANRRHAHESTAAARPVRDPLSEITVREAQTILDLELARLPDKYREPLLLCCLEGLSREEAAFQLGWNVSTVKNRLERARELLRMRLVSRGLTLSPAYIACFWEQAASAGVPSGLLKITVQAAVREGARTAMRMSTLWKGMLVLAVCLGVTAGAGVVRKALWSRPEAGAEVPQPAPGKPVWQPRLGIRGHHGWASYVELSPDGKTLVTFDPVRSELRFWDTVTAEERAVHPLKKLFTGGGSYKIGLFAPDGRAAVAVGQNVGQGPAVALFDVPSGKLRAILPGGEPLFSPDGKLLATGSNGAITLYEVATAKKRLSLAVKGDWSRWVSRDGRRFSPDGRLATSRDGVVKLWDTATGKELATFPGYFPLYNSESRPFSPDGKTLVTAEKDRTVRLWDVATGKQRAALRGHELPYIHAIFSPDGKTLATLGHHSGLAAGVNPGQAPAAEDQKKRPVEVKLWDVATGKELRTLPGNTFGDNRARFSPDGKTLAYQRGVPGEETHCVVLWDVAQGKERAILPDDSVGHFSPDGKQVMTVAGADLTFWDTATGQTEASLEASTEKQRQVMFLSFSADWRRLVTAAFYSPKGDPKPKSPNQVETEITLWEFTDRLVKKELRGGPPPAGADQPRQAAPQAKKAEAAPPANAWEAVKKEAETTETELFTRRTAAKTEEEARAVGKLIASARERFTTRALALARESPREAAALEALEYALRWTADGSTARLTELGNETIDVVRRDHLKSPSLDRLLWPLARQRTEAAEALLASALEQSPHRTVRGRAGYCLAHTLAQRAEAAQLLRQMPELAGELKDRPRHLTRLKATDVSKTARRAEELVERLCKDYADVPSALGRQPATLGEAAERALFALRHLAVGKVAPEIEGKDLDGKPLRLSASRGKVVVLVFCGFWCGPCRAMIPHEQALVRRLEGKPFALFWVNSDKDRVLAKEKMEKERLTWQSWWDGPDGPIARRWNVHSWPTIYVIDARGVIRCKQVREEALDRAVNVLLQEMEADKQQEGEPPGLSRRSGRRG